MNSDSLPNLQRRMYSIQLNIPGSFELYVNDIPARIENTGSMHNASVDINAYMLKSGKYKFKLEQAITEKSVDEVLDISLEVKISEAE